MLKQAKFTAAAVLLSFQISSCNVENFSGSSKREKREEPKPPPLCGDTNLLCSPEVEVDIPPKDPIEELITDKPPTVPQFGLLVNDPTCAFCHMTIHGDVASTRLVNPLWDSSALTVKGAWYAAEDFKADSNTFFSGATLPETHPQATKTKVKPSHFGDVLTLNIRDGLKKDLKVDKKLPKDLNKDGLADFPLLNLKEIEKNAFGEITKPEDASVFKNVFNGNLVLVGTKDKPIIVKGEVLIKGDLVIKGYYSGIGNIYVQGNIYIPADLMAINSAFPFPDNKNEAMVAAKKAIAAKKDALALATPNSILISDLDSYSLAGASAPTNFSPFDSNHWAVPSDRDYEALKVKQVYDWLPKAEYDALYEDNKIICDHARPINGRSFGLVEAFLYAGNTVGGWANHSSYAINGGVIADHFHIIAAAQNCPDEAHPAHGLNAKSNYINFDFRMQAGLQLLKQLSPYFEEQVASP